MPAIKKRAKTPTIAKEESPIHTTLQPPTLLFPESRPALVDTNTALRAIGKILQNGTRFASNAQINFNSHHNLLIELRNAFEDREQIPEEAEQHFFALLQSYLEQAQGHIPQAFLTEEQILHALSSVQLLLTQLRAQGYQRAFEHVASYLLLLAQSGFDRF